jgi:hypothetical protein
MTADALQIILDLQKQVDEWERFHIDLFFLLFDEKNVGYDCAIPELDYTEREIYKRVKELVKGKNEND